LLTFRIFIPSTIAVFGSDIPKQRVPNVVPLSPTTIYGVTKVFLENMGNYYHKKFNVDYRSIRFPGVISPTEYESHGTTDYASEIFFAAIKQRHYSLCLSRDTVLPMTYLDDILDGTVSTILTPD
jgi:threonine 3-dehydrogenase